MKSKFFSILCKISVYSILFTASALPVFFVFPYAVKIFLPFIIGAFFYFAAMPLNSFLLKKKFPSPAASLVSLTIITTVFGFFSWLILSKIFSELIVFAANIPDFYKAATEFFSAAADKIGTLGDGSLSKMGLSDNFGIAAAKIGDAFKKQAVELTVKISKKIIEYAGNLPDIFLVLFTAYLSAFFMLKDSRSIKNFARKIMGENFYGMSKKLKTSTFAAFFSYLRAQLITGSVIFLLLLAGFFLLRVRYALLLAVVTAAIDAIPVLGTGTVLLPWSLFKIFSNEPELGWGLLCLYGICTITRRICEPKIMGAQLGIHPLAVIFSVYAGLKLLGFIGIIAGPTAAIAAKNLFISPQRGKIANENKCEKN